MEFVETPQVLPVQRTVPLPAFNESKEQHVSDTPPGEWKTYEKILFRFSFIYFILLALPLDANYFRQLFSVDCLSVQFRDLFYLARFAPRFISDVPLFADWGIIALVATVGTVVWSYLDRQRISYDKLYYALRVVLRYRLALALLAYGFIKFFPLQMPEPSISNLNTNYGDFTAWKIFSMSTGIVPGYQSFLGGVEIFAALLLLYRKTASIGAFIIIPFAGNVFMSNLAYEGGEYVYSLYLISIALFLLAFDARRLIQLTSLEQPTLPNRFQPTFTESWQRYGRWTLKGGFIFLFVFAYGYKTYAAYKQGPYHFPAAAGLPDVEGIYNVSEFRINQQTLPPSATDPVRWKDVVFEKWATLSVRSNQKAQPELSNTEEIYLNDEQRLYELSGTIGRHYYRYQQEGNVLKLQNANPNHRGALFSLYFSRPSEGRIILSGVNEKSDSIYVVLDKRDKKYLLEEAAKQGRRRGLKL